MELKENELNMLLGNVASQLRGELSNLYLATRQLTPPSKRERSQTTDRKAALVDQSRFRMLRLVNNLEGIRLLTDDTPFLREECDIVSLTEEVCGEAESLAKYRELSLRFASPEPGHVCSIQPDRIRQLLYHLLSNAMKFTPEGGSIRVELRFIQAEKQILLSVEDTGSGIEPEMLSTLFDRYRQNNYTLPLPHGTGLGLAICQRIAQGHDGRLLAESKPGKGSKFTLCLPDRKNGEVTLRQPGFYDSSGGINRGLLALADAMPPDAFLIRNEE